MATIPISSPPTAGASHAKSQESATAGRGSTRDSCKLRTGFACKEAAGQPKSLQRLNVSAGSEKKRARVQVRAAVVETSPLPTASAVNLSGSPLEEIQNMRLITALKTPYLSDGRFDLDAYDSLVELQIKNGVEGLIVGGTTGEGHLMSWDEHIMLIAHTVNCFGKKVKVVGNTGSNSTREAIRASEQGFAVGMHAALQINPYYGKTSAEGLVTHFRAVASLGPTIVYNVPGRTGQDIPPRIIESLASLPNFAGVKECVGNDRVAGYTQQGLTIWSGNDDQCHDARWDSGARGVISVMSNLVPGLTRELMFGGRNAELNAKLMPLIEWLFCEPNPIGLNTALAMLGLAKPVFRLPYVPLSTERRREFVGIVEAIGLEHFVGSVGVSLLEDDDFSLIGRY